MKTLNLVKTELQIKFPEAKIQILPGLDSLFFYNHRSKIIIETTKDKLGTIKAYLKSHWDSNPYVIAEITLLISKSFTDVTIEKNFIFDENGEVFECLEDEDIPAPDDFLN